MVNPHTCKDLVVTSLPLVDLRREMEYYPNHLAIEDLSLTARMIWSRVRDQFYALNPGVATRRLNEQQVKSRVMKAKKDHYGDSAYGVVEVNLCIVSSHRH
jgi:hypothetical protein